MDASSTLASQDFPSSSGSGSTMNNYSPLTSHADNSSSTATSISGSLGGNNLASKSGGAAGVAAMAFTPGTQSINSYIQSRPDLG